MASVQYEVFTRYFNSIINVAVTNKTPKTWTPIDKKGTVEYNNADCKEVFEFGDTKDTSTRTYELQKMIVDENKLDNPKYDMIFVYNGVDIVSGAKEGDLPYALHDKFLRIKPSPWVLYSRHASLQSAMTKAKQLVNAIGKDNVLIGKVVSLEQYIEIV